MTTQQFPIIDIYEFENQNIKVYGQGTDPLFAPNISPPIIHPTEDCGSITMSDISRAHAHEVTYEKSHLYSCDIIQSEQPQPQQLHPAYDGKVIRVSNTNIIALLDHIYNNTVSFNDPQGFNYIKKYELQSIHSQIIKPLKLSIEQSYVKYIKFIGIMQQTPHPFDVSEDDTTKNQKIAQHCYFFDGAHILSLNNTPDKCIVVGDIHGDFHVLYRHLRRWLTKGIITISQDRKYIQITNGYRIIFLGDLIGSGISSLIVLFVVFNMLSLDSNDGKIFYIRGNHEDFIEFMPNNKIFDKINKQLTQSMISNIETYETTNRWIHQNPNHRNVTNVRQDRNKAMDVLKNEIKLKFSGQQLSKEQMDAQITYFISIYYQRKIICECNSINKTFFVSDYKLSMWYVELSKLISLNLQQTPQLIDNIKQITDITTLLYCYYSMAPSAVIMNGIWMSHAGITTTAPTMTNQPQPNKFNVHLYIYSTDSANIRLADYGTTEMEKYVTALNGLNNVSARDHAIFIKPQQLYQFMLNHKINFIIRGHQDVFFASKLLKRHDIVLHDPDGLGNQYGNFEQGIVRKLNSGIIDDNLQKAQLMFYNVTRRITSTKTNQVKGPIARIVCNGISWFDLTSYLPVLTISTTSSKTVLDDGFVVIDPQPSNMFDNALFTLPYPQSSSQTLSTKRPKPTPGGGSHYYKKYVKYKTKYLELTKKK